ncbi:ribose transport system ATP-binding protein [Mameliella alba]|uniref:sugar ABC transporter ATP-binding protein n=1 Tax=Mameliella alba TaxID=561184 RepID=UPI00088D9204|nr:sugar ABC transporter ATP-binding protein [Mameliella alba]OWV48789.1 sugar ABC transporter ATP-binding protein [Mameliella alba]PTR39363.1 ribose transport system ATP-binding protein [Mameliella alba]GGF65340.1 ribose import ATP-binding protein RbsA 2 [Mameliella alba]SDD32180.1 ribose transport system ATP-binding protein [Mameliella alba]
MTDPVIEMQGITKSFPGVRALSGVSFGVRPGEVQALVGENGAGKSTLIKILSGVYQADAGEVRMNGEAVHFVHPVESLRAGIAVIYQEFSLLPERTVAQNLFLGREPRTRFGLIDSAKMRADTREVLALFAAAGRIDPDRTVGELDVATQQVVEIAKAVSTGARVVVMDEPTAALNEAECEELFATVDTLRARGVAIIYITHRMREITRLADRVTVLKDGEVAARFDEVPAPDAIVRAMVGRDIADFYAPPATPEEIGDPVLTVRGAGNAMLHQIDLDVRAGEIVGLAGIQGAGRVALAMALFGETPFEHGQVTLNGERVSFQTPRSAILGGIGLLPGDRKSEGLVLMQSVRDNGMLTSRAFAPLWSSDRRNAFTDRARMDALLDHMEIRAASYDQDIRALSGGNQQKAIVARWLSMRPKLLIFIEPTRGIDVNSKAGIYHLMRDLAREGAGILMISSDLPEVIGAADRVLVMQEGRIAAEFPHGATEQDIMHAATGETGVAA